MPGSVIDRPVAAAALIASLAVCIVFAGCGDSAGPATSGKPSIVVTTGMVGELVQAIVKETAEVQVMMGPGVDPHLHQPTRGDAVDLKRADVVVYNGLHLEGQLGAALQQRALSGGNTFVVAEGVPTDQLLAAEAGFRDPHLWMDLSLWAQAVVPLAEKLAAVFPQHREAYLANAEAYRDQLMQLDRWAAKSLESIPPGQRVMITAHDAFRYFGRRYGLEVHGVQGVSTVSEAAIRDVTQLVELIVQQDVPAVFFETSVSKRQVEAIVDGARARGKTVSADHTLYSDSLGPTGSGADTYLGMMRANVQTITEALGGEVAPLPNSLPLADAGTKARDAT